MSQHTDGCEKAHLCPVQEDAWFHENQMQTYNHDNKRTGTQAIYDVNNMLLLRSDLHTSFDEKKFAFVPKPGADDPSKMQFVTHLLDPSVELARLYHNAVIQPIDSIPSEFLLVRLAWALFPMIEGFLLTKASKVLVTEEEGARIMSADACRAFLKPKASRTKGGSQPQKRGRPDDDNALQDEGDHHGTSLDSTKRVKMFSISQRPITKPLTPPTTVEGSSSHKASPPSPPTRAAPILATRADEIDLLNGMSEADRLDSMRERALEGERKRSDPQGHWTEELVWAEWELRQTRASPGSLNKMYEVLGMEVLETRDESL